MMTRGVWNQEAENRRSDYAMCWRVMLGMR